MDAVMAEIGDKKVKRLFVFAAASVAIVAAALSADCDTLWSEDMQHGLTVENRLRIADPFA